MTVYALAQISVHDREAYGRYQARFMDVFQRFRGRLLAADEAPTVMEGDWPHQKVILMAFPDEAALRDWADSEAYREISKDREAGTTGVALMVKGLG
ncbi:MAG TPA: DUF1330 domain-containing protein [Caulobacter sp.]|nr:DUF1330 domain-containing protein [Caulobacter sp.]